MASSFFLAWDESDPESREEWLYAEDALLEAEPPPEDGEPPLPPACPACGDRAEGCSVCRCVPAGRAA